MKTSARTLLALAAILAAPSLATAALKDVGPVDPALGFPSWYRDTNGAALALCTEQRPSPNAEAGGSPMCFPIVPNPDGFAGNLGDENFYYNASAALAGANGFDMLWEGALEATYANGTPIKGDEIVFARIRIVMSVGVAGTYTVTHPYGVDVFPNVQPGKRAIFYTVDIGVAPGIFTGALNGAVGPYLEWSTDAANPNAPYGLDPVSLAPYSLSIANADGGTVQFLGDPNTFHAVTGSPFGTNLVRVDGPPGSNLDGAGNDFVVTNQFAIVGQRHSAPIPAPLQVIRATMASDAGLNQVDVIAKTVPGAKLVATGPNVPTTELDANVVTGEGWSHVEFPAGATMPTSLTVTNITDNPHSAQTVAILDVVQASPAVFFPDFTGLTGGSVSVIAESSVHTNPAPSLQVLELPGVVGVPNPSAPWQQQFSSSLPVGAMPLKALTIVSSHGGNRIEPVVFGVSGVLAPAAPVALPAALSTSQGASVSFVALDPGSPTALPVVLNPPANGAAVANPDGTITYTPRNLFNGPDAFTYVLTMPDPANPAKVIYSNAGDVSVTVIRVNVAPTAVNDSATAAGGTPIVINLAANDTDLDGTVVPASVAIVSPPAVGTLVNNGDGTVTFTPPAGYNGQPTFTYTIQDNEGLGSAPGTVTVTVSSVTELLNATVEWIVSKARYKAVGTSSIFGAGVNNRVSMYQGGDPQNLGPFIGEAPIDVTGKFQIDAPSSVALDGTNKVTLVSTGGGVTVVTAARK